MRKINPKIIGVIMTIITILLLGVVAHEVISPDAEPAPILTPTDDTGTD